MPPVRKCDGMCSKEIKETDEVIKCSCNKTYHVKCSEVGKLEGLYKFMKSAKHVLFKCEECVNDENKIENVLVRILESIEKLERKVESENEDVVKRIVSVEAVLKKANRSVVDEVMKIDEKVTATKWAEVVKRKKRVEHNVVVKHVDKDKSCDDVMKIMNRVMDPNGLNTSGISRRGNSIMIRCDDIETQDSIVRSITSDVDTLTAMKPDSVMPKIKMLRVRDPSTDDDEFIRQVKAKNENVPFKSVKILKREKVFRMNKCIETMNNIVLEVDCESYERIMSKGKIKYKWESFDVVDNIFIRRCYKCFGFSHMAAECKNERACPICAQNHEKGNCKVKDKKCINCITANNKFKTKFDVNHCAWDKECKIYQNKLATSKKVFERKK